MQINTQTINDGGPAFPVPMFTRQADGQPMTAGEFFEGGNGMTLRDWFAGMALQGMFSNSSIIDTFSAHKTMSDEAYKVADAMIKARTQKGDDDT